MRAAAVAVFAALAIAGCGSSDVGAGPASSADLLKPGALVYWETVTDPDSEQWKQAQDLLDKFPDGDRWIAELKQQVENEGVSWDQDVEPALGSVVDVAVYARSGEAPWVVALTNPDDKDKLLELVRKLNEKSETPAVSRVLGDWVALSESQEAIGAALKDPGGPSLADDEAFKSAMQDLADDGLTRVYVDPARAVEFASGAMERKALATLGLDDLDFAGAWAKAKKEGGEVALALRGEGADRLLGTGDAYSSNLLEKVPDDAFAFVSFQGGGLRAQLERVRNEPLLDMGIREFERETGVDVDEIISLLEGEIAFYARPSVGPVPELTLLLDSEDPIRAKAAVEQIVRQVSDRLDRVQLTVDALDGVVVVSTSSHAIDDLRASGDKLKDSDRYKRALDAAGAPDDYTGLAYVDLTQAWDLIRSYLGFSGEGEELPPQISRNLEPLQSLVAYGTQDGSLSTTLLFVEID